MKITKLTLENFRSYGKETFVFDRINIVRGPNAVGKSSLQFALELLLTGTCYTTDLAGRGAEKLIRSGTKGFLVSMEGEHKGLPLDLTLTKSPNSSSLSISSKRGQAAGTAARNLLTAIVAPTEVLRAVLNSGRFVEMNEQQQRALLADALAADPVAVDADIQTAYKALELSPVPDVVRSTLEVDFHYKRVFDERASLKRSLAGLGDAQEPQLPPDLPERAAVSRQIQELQAQRNQLVEQRSKMEVEYARTSERAAANRRRRDELKSTIDRAKSKLMPESEHKRTVTMAQSKTEADQLDAAIAVLKAKVEVGKREIANSTVSDTCGECGRKHTPQTIKQRQLAHDERVEEVKKWENDLSTKQVARRRLGDPAQCERALADYREHVGEIARAERELAEIESVGVPVPPDTAKLTLEIEAIDERLKKGREVEARVITLHAQRDSFARSVKLRDSLQTKIAGAEKVVEYFSDRGTLKAKLVGGRVAPFRDRMNEVLKRFGFRCEFSLDPFQLAIFREGVDVQGLALVQLSESQLFRFSVAFQVALAEATGVRMVVIDRADVLLPELRSQLTAELMGSNLEQAFVLASARPAESAPQSIEGVRFINLDMKGGETIVAKEQTTHA